jgi:hypothetical protein
VRFIYLTPRRAALLGSVSYEQELVRWARAQYRDCAGPRDPNVRRLIGRGEKEVNCGGEGWGDRAEGRGTPFQFAALEQGRAARRRRSLF